MHLYNTFCVLLYTQSALQSCGGGGLSSTTTSVQHPLGWCDGCHRTTAPVRSPHTSYRWRGEREIEPIKWMGIIRRPWLIRASGGNLARTPGLHPTLYEKCHGIFNDHRESGPRFNVSSERRCLLTVWCPPSLHWGVRTHTDHRVSIPLLASLTPLPDSGWRDGLWSIVRSSLTSSGIIGEHLALLNLANGGFIKVLKKRVPLIVANVY